MDNIYPESQLPKDYHYLGDIRNIREKNLCLDSVLNGEDNGKLILSECTHETHQQIFYNQLFMFSKQNQIINDENCLNVFGINQTVILEKCQTNERQKWIYDENTQTLMNWQIKGCLDITDQRESTLESQLILLECDDNRISQKWLFQDNFEWQSPNHSSRI